MSKNSINTISAIALGIIVSCCGLIVCAQQLPSSPAVVAPARQEMPVAAPGLAKDFISQARQGEREIFPNQKLRDAQKQRLVKKIKDLTATAGTNQEDQELIAHVRTWIDKADTATAPKVAQAAAKALDAGTVKKLKEFILLARQEPQEIFSDPLERENRKIQLIKRLHDLSSTTQNPGDAQLIRDTHDWITKAYAATTNALSFLDRDKLQKIIKIRATRIFPRDEIFSAAEQLQHLEARASKLNDQIKKFEQQATLKIDKDIVKKTTTVIEDAYRTAKDFISKAGEKQKASTTPVHPIVAAIMETTVASEEAAPAMETPFDAPPEAPPLTPEKTTVPSTTTPQQIKPRPAAKQAQSFSDRGGLLADIRQGKTLRPTAATTKPPVAPQTAKPSMLDSLKEKLAQRRTHVEDPENEEDAADFD